MININDKITANASKGFTLVELIIVIAILGILVSISIISFTNLISKSHTSVDENTAKKIERTISLYITESNDSNLSQIPHSSGTELVENLQLQTIITPNSENDIVGNYGPYLDSNASNLPNSDFTGWDITITGPIPTIKVTPSNTNSCTIN